MDHQQALFIGRDIALIILAIETMVLVLVPGVALYFMTRWLREFLPKVRPFLGSAATTTSAVEQKAKRITHGVTLPFIAAHALVAGVRRGALEIARRR